MNHPKLPTLLVAQVGTGVTLKLRTFKIKASVLHSTARGEESTSGGSEMVIKM